MNKPQGKLLHCLSKKFDDLRRKAKLSRIFFIQFYLRMEKQFLLFLLGKRNNCAQYFIVEIVNVVKKLVAVKQGFTRYVKDLQNISKG